MAFCTNCGAELSEGAKFCTECGAKVFEAENQEPAQPAQVPDFPVQGNYPPPASVENWNAGRTDPQLKTGEPGFTFQNTGKKKNTGLIVGVVILGVVLVAALVFILVSMLGTSGAASAGKDILGRYEGVRCFIDGIDIGAEDEWVELKSGGKAQLHLLGDTYNGKWTLDGENLTITESSDEYFGTLRDGVMTVDFYGMAYTFAKDGAQVPETVAQTETAPGGIPTDVRWWEGDWYGWWILQNGTGSWEELSGNFWDACARVWVEDDGTGFIEFWDEDNEAGECFANATVTFTADGTSAAQGTMVCGEGVFWNADLIEGAWVAYPDDSPMGPAIDNVICVRGSYVDPDNIGDSFDYEIYLRPWGTEWEDVRGADTSQMPYDDMMPAYYDSWYLPLIKDGVTEAPDLVGK